LKYLRSKKEIPFTALFTGAIGEGVIFFHHFGNDTPFFDFLLFSELFEDFVFFRGPKASLSHYKLIKYSKGPFIS
jgi:hypothetical protein